MWCCSHATGSYDLCCNHFIESYNACRYLQQRKCLRAPYRGVACCVGYEDIFVLGYHVLWNMSKLYTLYVLCVCRSTGCRGQAFTKKESVIEYPAVNCNQRTPRLWQSAPLERYDDDLQNRKAFTKKECVIEYPAVNINQRTPRLVQSVPSERYDAIFKIENRLPKKSVPSNTLQSNKSDQRTPRLLQSAPSEPYDDDLQNRKKIF